MTTILDHRGLPFERAQIAEPQTARLAQLHSEYENHPSRGLTPPKLAAILQRAEQGDLTSQHELFADMEEKDAHLFSELQKRRLALQTLDWDVVPPPNASAAEKSLAAYAKEMISEMADFEDVVFDMSDAVGHGFAALELEWRQVEKNLLPVCATHRPQGWFRLPQTPGVDRNELRLRDNSADGEQLWPFGWLLHKHKSRSGYVSRSGLFRVLAWPFLFKNYAVRDLAEFLEIYGLPLRLGTYNPSATKEDKAALLRAVVNIGHDAAAIIPEGMAIDFQKAAEGMDGPFSAMISHMEAVMSKAILGGTLTSGEGSHGSQALGNVHNEVRHELKDADARQLGAALSDQLVYPILAVNKGLAEKRRCPRLVFDTQEPEDLELYSTAVPKLVGMGMRIRKSWAHDKLKIPEAQGDEEVLEVARPQEILPPEEKADPAKPAAAKGPQALAKLKAAPTAEPDELDALAAEMLGEWENAADPMRNAVETAIATATSFEDFSQALESGLATIPTEQLVDLLARGSFAARMWGQLNTPKKPAA